MSYAESISLKLINNTSTDQPIGLLGGTSSTYANSDNNVLIQWDLATEDFTGTTVTLETTTPVTVDLQTQSVKGVADALNTTNKATFTFSGTFIYATSLLDNSVQSADIVVGDSVSTPVVLGYLADGVGISSLSPAEMWRIWQGASTRGGLTEYISSSDSVEVGTQFYQNEELTNPSNRIDYFFQGISASPTNILKFGGSGGILTDIIPTADLPTDFSPTISGFTDYTSTNIFSGNNGLGKALITYNISANGKYLFGIDSTNAVIYRFSFTTAWDFSTLNTTSDQSFNILATVPSAGVQAGFTLDPTGQKFYFRDNGNGGYRTIFLSTAWDLTTGSVGAFSSNATNTFNRFTWNGNGDYIVGLLVDINISNYSTAFGRFNLAQYQSEQIEPNASIYINPVGVNSPNLNQLITSTDGSKWYVLYKAVQGGNPVYQIVEVDISDYSDITTISQNTESTQFSNNAFASATGLWWNQDNTKLYVIEGQSNGDIFIDEIG